jgi:hypothetical protein
MPLAPLNAIEVRRDMHLLSSLVQLLLADTLWEGS